MKQTARLLKALADETRLRILSLLFSEGEICVCDVIAALKLPQSTVSRHLAYLRKAGWVSDRRCGLWMYYSIDNGKNEIQKDLAEFLRRNLATFPVAAADRECLENFAKNNRCA